MTDRPTDDATRSVTRRMMRMYSRDSSISLSTESWATSVSTVTSPARRRYDNSPRDNRQLVTTFPACGRDPQPANRAAQLVSVDVVDRARRHDLVVAAAADDDEDDDDDDDDDASRRHNEMTRTAVRPWLMH